MLGTLHSSKGVFTLGAIALLCGVSRAQVAQEAYLKASNTDDGDRFGISVAVSRDTIVVGSRNESSDATGINGTQGNNNSLNAGAAYVFVRESGIWTQQAYLKASNAGLQDQFGATVAIAGDTIVVGAPFERNQVGGINGDETDNSLSWAGAAYVFERTGTNWAQQAYLKAPDPDQLDFFAGAVAISGDTIVVGARGDQSQTPGVNGDPFDNSGANGYGAAHVFHRTGSIWTQQAFLKPSHIPTGVTNFGHSVAISGDSIAVGAPLERSGSTGINGDEINIGETSSGAVYVFVRQGTAWSQQAYVKASNTGAHDRFGHSLSVAGDLLVVGAPHESSNASVINGDELDNTTPSSGAAYVFSRSGTVWSQQAYLKAFNPDAGDLFGHAVVADGEFILVSALEEESSSAGIDGDPFDNSLPHAGAAYLFQRTGTTWSQDSYIKSSNPDSFSGDRFGTSVSMNGARLVAGALDENSHSTGVNGDMNNEFSFSSGAAYVFDREADFPPFATTLCSGDGGVAPGCSDCPCMNNSVIGSSGGCLNSAMNSARLQVTGDPSVSLPSGSITDLRFNMLGGIPGGFAVLTSGITIAPRNMAHPCFGLASGVQSANMDGLRCVVMNLRRHGGRSIDAVGHVGVSNAPWGGEGAPPAGIARAGFGFFAGQSHFFQVVYRDDDQLSCMRGLNTSQAVGVTFTP